MRTLLPHGRLTAFEGVGVSQQVAATLDFEAIEQTFARSLGIEIRSKYLDLTGPVDRARVIEGGRGDPLFFVHGGGSVAAQWLPLMAQLAGRRLISVDRPGCGLTDAFHYADDVDLRAHAVGFLTGVLDALELETVDIVANSIGGLWCLWLALDAPERVGRLVLVGCPSSWWVLLHPCRCESSRGAHWRSCCNAP